jgi:Holliday junction resolvase RusA-like endonuclease
VTFVIKGAPRTKKNSLRRIKRGRRVFTVPSLAHEAWAVVAIAQLRRQYQPDVVRWIGVDNAAGAVTSGKGPIVTDVNMRAIVYRERAGRADLLNFLAAVSDALEAAGVLKDDKQVASVDGSRLRIDRQRPRVEIELTPAATPSPSRNQEGAGT